MRQGFLIPTEDRLALRFLGACDTLLPSQFAEKTRGTGFSLCASGKGMVFNVTLLFVVAQLAAPV
jgi:hypothetical protein